MKDNNGISSSLKEELTASNVDDRVRGWVKLALEMTRKLQSNRTGLIHGSFEPQDEARVTVPIPDNFAFVLLLFRSRQTEHIQEARTLLQRLLNWQSPATDRQGGNFPLYLHDIPAAYDRYLPAFLLPILFRIASEYDAVLGADLRTQLQQSCAKLLDYSVHLIQERLDFLPLVVKVKLASGLLAFGRLWQGLEWQEVGVEVLKEVYTIDIHKEWVSPYLLGELFNGLSIVYQQLDLVPWPGLQKLVLATWHRESSNYCGPGFSLCQQYSEPQVLHYHLYWALNDAQISQRLLIQHPAFYLSIAQIYPWLNMGQIQSQENSGLYRLEDQERSWMCGKDEKWAWSYISGPTPDDPAKVQNYHPLRLVFGTPQFAHTFACQLPEGATIQWQKEGNAFIAEVVFNNDFIEGDKESGREVIFAWDRREQAKVTVEGAPVSLFFLEQKPLLTFPEGEIQFAFESEGEGAFVGNIIPGNRWSQRALKSDRRYELYDTLLFLRTLHRTKAAKIKIRIDVKIN